MVPVGLDYLVAKSTVTVAMQVFWFPIKIGLRLSKKPNEFHLKCGTYSTGFLRCYDFSNVCYAGI